MEQKMLQILSNCRSFRELMQTHLQIIIHGAQDDPFLLRKLIDLSSSFKSIGYALRLFRCVQSPNVFIYNTLIKCFNENGSPKDAFVAFKTMKENLVAPNNFTFTFLLKSCDSVETFQLGRGVHAQIVKSGFGSSVFVQNTLLDFYSKCCIELDFTCQLFDEMSDRDAVSWNSLITAYVSRGDMGSAIQTFESMPVRNVVSWNAVIAGLSKAGDMDAAWAVFEQMPVKNMVSWNTLIAGYVKCNDIVSARSIFDDMPERDAVSWTAMITGYTKAGDLALARYLFDLMPIKNVVSWNTMVAGYIHNHMFDQALLLFHQFLLRSELKPDEVTLTSVLSACAHLGALEHGTWVNSYIKKNNFELSVTLGNALIDMLAKCGDVENAKAVFDQMPKRCIITWTTMVSGLAFNGQCRDALSLFDAMCREKVELDDVIFIAILTACTHGGLVEDGLRIFDQMVREFGIKPRIEHYGCMVDLLGRAGKLEEAIEFIENMPMEPNSVIWATLLGSCKNYGNKQLAEFVANKIIDLEPSNSAYSVLISNSNASMGKWWNVINMRIVMRDKGLEKVPGCSSIQIGSEVHEFLVKDTRHAMRKEIYEALDGLAKQLKVVGYMPCTNHINALLYPLQ